MADLYREYAETKKERNKSWKQQDALVTKYLLPRWSKLKCADIKRGDVKTLVGKIKAPILANQVLAAASAVFAWAIGEDLVTIAANPCVGVKRNKTTKRERILSDSELPKFWTGFDKVDFVEGMALKFLLLTGQCHRCYFHPHPPLRQLSINTWNPTNGWQKWENSIDTMLDL